MLFVGASQDDFNTMMRILRDSAWDLDVVPTRRDALDYMECKQASVVICECDLPDGNWRDLLDSAALLKNRPAMIIASRSADDRLWAEVLNLGGCDVLAKPFESKEVVWSIHSAWHEWSKRCGESLETEAIPWPA